MALTSPIRKTLCAMLAICALAWPAVAGQALPINGDISKNLVPHRAVYDIRMVARHDGAQILNISGQMTYEWQRDCDAWLTRHHFKLAYEYPNAPVLNIVSDFTTYEPFDGRSLNFTSRRTREGDMYEELRGHAALNDDGTGMARFSMPATLKFNLSRGTLFPMMHTLALLDSIKKGRKIFNAVVFDGSDDEGPVEINAVTEKKIDPGSVVAPSARLDPALLRGAAWKVRLAFFPVQDTAAESDYEMNAVIGENGVISDMRVDYKDFSVTQKLVAIERLKNAVCGVK